MTTNFISRYEKAFTRQECRDIIDEIEFFDSNALLFDQNAKESYLQDQKAINPGVDLCINLTTSARVTKKIFPKNIFISMRMCFLCSCCQPSCHSFSVLFQVAMTTPLQRCDSKC